MPGRVVRPCPRCRSTAVCACRRTASRGYGGAHQAARRRLAEDVAAGLRDCARCGRPIMPGQAWHLDHTADRTAYLGPSHADCNSGAAKTPRHTARNALAPSAPLTQRGRRERYLRPAASDCP